jgi:hypothetical protein
MKANFPRWHRAAVLAGVVAVADGSWLAAQSAEADWARLQARAKSAPAGENSPGAADPARAVAQQRQKDHFEALAADAEKFAREHKGHAKEAGAKHLEAKALLSASLLDDAQGSPQRALAAADAVRQDPRQPAVARFEVAVLAERARERKFKDRAQWLAARESSARALLAEFPAEAGAHALLLELAQHHEGAKAAALARELLASAAPAPLKARADDLLVRQALVGQTLAEALRGVPGFDAILAPAAGRPVVIYAWAPESAGSAVLALDLAKHAPADTVFLGLNVSPAARDPRAAAQGLPGAQLFAGRAFDHPLARALRLDAPRLVCIADRAGRILVAGAPGNPAEQFKGF